MAVRRSSTCPSTPYRSIGQSAPGPLLVPIIKSVGINTVHFGIVVTVNLAIGLFHPPFGINIFVAQSVLGLKLETIYRGIIPFVIIYLIALALITYIPEISLFSMNLLLAKP